MLATLFLTVLLTANAVANQNPCTAPRAVGDAASFAVASSTKNTRRRNGMAEIQMMSRLIDSVHGRSIGWMYVDQDGKRWIQLSANAGKRDHELFHARYIPARPGYDYQTVYPFNRPALPNGIRIDSCEMR